MDKIKIAEYLSTSSTTQTASTFYSDVPWEFSAWESGEITGYVKNFGNLDNELTIKVLWGESEESEYPFEHGSTPSSNTLFWKADNTLIQEYFCGAAVGDEVPVRIVIPRMKSNFMKLQFDLSGTTQSINMELYFRGGSLWL